MSFSSMYYWFSVIENLDSLLSIFLVFSTMLLVIAYINANMENYENANMENYEDVIKFCKKWRWVLLLWIPLCFIPSKNTMIVMYAGDKVESIISSEKAKDFGGKAYDALNIALDQYISKNKK